MFNNGVSHTSITTTTYQPSYHQSNTYVSSQATYVNQNQNQNQSFTRNSMAPCEYVSTAVESRTNAVNESVLDTSIQQKSSKRSHQQSKKSQEENEEEFLER